MIGTAINAVALVLGFATSALPGLQPTAPSQRFLKALLGATALFLGFQAFWLSLGGGWWRTSKHILMLLLGLSFSRFVGSLCGLQRISNRFGGFATETLLGPTPPARRAWSSSFLACCVLFVLSPMALVGALLEGGFGNWGLLAVKAVMDGLAMQAIAPRVGAAGMLCLIPLVAVQGSLVLGGRALVTELELLGISGGLHATLGFLCIGIASLTLETQKVQIADYLPSLMIVPLLWWLVR